MRKTEVYQIRLDSQEKKQAFAVFKQLGITPAQAVRLFFKQVVLTKSIPFSIENQSINLEQLIRLRKLKQQDVKLEQPELIGADTSESDLLLDDEHMDLFEELNAILGESDKS
ncbi:type II toxin-antitoxin system RelB/DinJ family antitoxin [Acinetobacter pragensis]|uniref:XRE family transcriptional regulator n=1 Tax=Acinetobacter pragensis TaxID=1806892 RepID=A0A151Y361_9GAMM|nr:type II toxin-antitoxin system RelB/DinJ family antitoxin [Acinetobacter pragensis]KYQ72456.1 XRE family transcriptional regulator [Acinetobacter pragensis]